MAVGCQLDPCPETQGLERRSQSSLHLRCQLPSQPLLCLRLAGFLLRGLGLQTNQSPAWLRPSPSEVGLFSLQPLSWPFQPVGPTSPVRARLLRVQRVPEADLPALPSWPLPPLGWSEAHRVRRVLTRCPAPKMALTPALVPVGLAQLRTGQAVAGWITPSKNPELLQQGTLGQPLTIVGGDEADQTRIDLEAVDSPKKGIGEDIAQWPGQRPGSKGVKSEEPHGTRQTQQQQQQGQASPRTRHLLSQHRPTHRPIHQPILASHGRPKGSTYSRIPRCSPEKPFCLDSPTQPWPRRLVLSLGGAARGLGRRSCPLFDLERWGYPRSSATMQKQSW